MMFVQMRSGEGGVEEEQHVVTVAQWDVGVQMLARTLILIAHHWKDFIRQCGFC